MAVRSRRLFGPLLLTASDAVIYTVPSGRTAVLRSVILCNLTGTARAVTLRISGTGSGDVCYSNTVPIGTTIAYPGSLILDPDDTLRGLAAAASAITIVGFGSLLLGEPE